MGISPTRHGCEQSTTAYQEVSASSKGIVTIIQYIQDNGLFREKGRAIVKGINTDGGNPCFSCDGSYVFFCTESAKIWRYTCDNSECCCVYQVKHPDQHLSLDIYADQILVTLNSSVITEHNGFDIVTLNGDLVKPLCFDSVSVLSRIIRGKWLNKEKILALHPLSLSSAYNIIQIIPWKRTDHLDTDAFATKTEKSSRVFFDIRMSPHRNYMSYVWIDMLRDGRFSIEIYEAKSNKKLNEYWVDSYTDIAFSDDEKHIFVCSEEFMKIDLIS